MNGSGKAHRIKNGLIVRREEYLTPSSSLASVSSAQFDLSTDLDDSPNNNSFKFISSNFHGLLSKKASFLQLIWIPHFISGTESWLNSTVLSSEIFPSEYQVFRSDRTDGYGGVLPLC